LSNNSHLFCEILSINISFCVCVYELQSDLGDNPCAWSAEVVGQLGVIVLGISPINISCMAVNNSATLNSIGSKSVTPPFPTDMVTLFSMFSHILENCMLGTSSTFYLFSSLVKRLAVKNTVMIYHRPHPHPRLSVFCYNFCSLPHSHSLFWLCILFFCI